MALKQNFELMAGYNQWMNEKVYTAAASFDQIQLAEDKGAFFGSILGSLNHILVGDTIWLKRFALHPAQYSSLEAVRSFPVPAALNQILYNNFTDLRNARSELDKTIVSWSVEASESDYERDLSYSNTKGLSFTKKFGFLVHHFYNHQTHHRGQITTLLTQCGADVGVTDLVAFMP
ncbi:DinB family protein [Alkalimarinus coralli]|uniref:DinB family protein n=1 Tax=Alkalimarinus coralli TaxID=2935863 RepID=UPI00202ACBF9|nr:DinB family protein [Alkalimarinus coralli]